MKWVDVILIHLNVSGVVMTLTMDPGYFRMYRNGNSSQRTSHDELVVYSTGYCAFFSFTIKVRIIIIYFFYFNDGDLQINIGQYQLYSPN